MTPHDFDLSTGEHVHISADPSFVEVLIDGECHLVLAWDDVRRLMDAVQWARDDVAVVA